MIVIIRIIGGINIIISGISTILSRIMCAYHHNNLHDHDHNMIMIIAIIGIAIGGIGIIMSRIIGMIICIIFLCL